MNYLSAKQMAEQWGVSPRRVVLLASQGRIAGARQLEGRWFFPEDVPKPTDPRRQRQAESQKPDERFVFPFLLACVNSREQLRSFSPEEAALYDLCLTYETGDFRKTRRMAEELLHAENRYIRLGALYHLPTACMYLGDYEATDRYFVLFRAALRDTDAHSPELQLLECELVSELVSVSEFAEQVKALDTSPLPDCLFPMISTWKLLAEITECAIRGNIPDISPYELISRMIDMQGFFFSGMMTHAYLSFYYAVQKDTEKEYAHIRRAIDMGLEHGTVFTLAYTLAYFAEDTDIVLRDYPPETRDRFRQLASVFISSRNAYAGHHRMASIAQLTENDYRLISCCLKSYSVEQMADVFGLSKSGINRRLSVLYDKLGVRSKSEMTRSYLHSVLDWSNN